MRCQLTVLGLILSAGLLPAQHSHSAADSALVGRILLAEDRRTGSDPALAQGEASADSHIQALAVRARFRIYEATLPSRDSLLRPAAPPSYSEPAWRLRYRAITGKQTCAEQSGALSDSVWAVRLHAADQLTAPCADAPAVATLTRWASSLEDNSVRAAGDVSWQPAAHALVALARLRPDDARAQLQRFAQSRIAGVRMYAARAAGILGDTATLTTLGRDADDNVKEVAIEQLVAGAAHSADDVYLDALSAHGYQAIRAGALALKGSPNGSRVYTAALAASHRVRRDSSETARDARLALLDRLAEFLPDGRPADIAAFGTDYDCAVAAAAARIVKASPNCTPMLVTLPRDAVSLALGREVVLRVTMADSSGGGHFDVRLRGDVAPIMGARVLALVRQHAYDNHAWFRVEPDFVIEGGGPGNNEYVGFPHFMRDELSALPQLRGTVGMSTRGHDTGDGQWFVNLRDNVRLTRDYTTFAEVIDGIDVVDGVLEGDVIATIEVLPGA